MKIYDTDNESYVVNRFGKIYMFASVDWPPDKDYEVVEALPDDAEERTAFYSGLMPPAWMEVEDGIFPVYIETGQTVAHREEDGRGSWFWVDSKRIVGKWGIWDEWGVKGEITVYDEDEEHGWEIIGHIRAGSWPDLAVYGYTKSTKYANGWKDDDTLAFCALDMDDDLPNGFDYEYVERASSQQEMLEQAEKEA